MTEQSGTHVPRILIELELENTRVGFRIDATPADTERVLEWLMADPLRWALITVAFALGQPHKGDLPAGEETLTALAAALAQVRAEHATPSLEEALGLCCPMGSFQRKPLSTVVAAGEPGRAWLRWALQRPWTQDPRFREALRIVCEAEGVLETSDDDEAGTP